MFALFSVLFLLFLIIFIIGVIKPAIINNFLKKDYSRKHLSIRLGLITFILFVIAVILTPSTTELSSNTNNKKPTQVPVAKATSTPEPSVTLTPEQKAQVVAIITKNTDHFKQLWQDGKNALGTTQYANANEGLVALNDPTSNASKFSEYKQKENPANDNSMNDALQQADKYYPSNASDDKLNTWRIDMIQLSSDMGVWVDKATSWQISEIPTSELNSAEQTVNDDFVTVEKDIQAINQ